MIWFVVLMLISFSFGASVNVIKSVPDVLYGGSTHSFSYEVVQSSSENITATFLFAPSCNEYTIRSKGNICACKNGEYTCFVPGVKGKNILEFSISIAPNIEPRDYSLKAVISGFDYSAPESPRRYYYSSGGGFYYSTLPSSPPAPTTQNNTQEPAPSVPPQPEPPVVIVPNETPSTEEVVPSSGVVVAPETKPKTNAPELGWKEKLDGFVNENRMLVLLLIAALFLGLVYIFVWLYEKEQEDNKKE